MSESSIHLVVRRTIRASPERVFAAWTTPEQLMTWWGPQGALETLGVCADPAA